MRKIPSSIEFTVDNFKEELRAIGSRYNLPKNIYQKIVTAYRYDPSKMGCASRNLDYLSGLLSDYGYTQEQFEKYITRYSELITSNATELERKIVILNAQKLLDTVLFEHPYDLLGNHAIDSLSLYAICANLKVNDIEVTYDSVYRPEYKGLQLERLKKAYPLKVVRYDLYTKLLEIRRRKMREDEIIKFALDKKEEE